MSLVHFLTDSLYHLACGQDAHAAWLRDTVLGLTLRRVGRYRDACLNADGSRIFVYTRNGAAEGRVHDKASGIRVPCADCPCLSCCINYHVRTHACYLGERDEKDDRTYTTLTYRVPDDFVSECRQRATGKEPATISAKMDQAISSLQGRSRDQARADPRFAAMKDTFAKIDASSRPGGFQALFDADKDWLAWFAKQATVPAPPGGAALAAGATVASPAPRAAPREAPRAAAAAAAAAPSSVMTTQLQRVCPKCSARALRRCGRCKAQWYCSQACQGADWPLHKLSCAPPAFP
jgi:hypothetical protein